MAGMITNAEWLRDLLRKKLATANMEPTELARRIGRKSDYIRDFLNGRKNSLGQTELAAIERELGFQMTAALKANLSDDEAAQQPSIFNPPPEILGIRDLPVYSAVEGGPGEMVVSTEPIEIVPRPWYMREVRDGFAVLITGDSMEPAFEAGDMAIVNPRLAPMRNKNTIFVSDNDNGEFRATIKRLLTWTADKWRVRQFNEPRDFDLDRHEWIRALRVVGKYENG